MSDDRRRFFRISDTLGVAYRPLSAEEQEAVEAGLPLCAVDTFTLIAGCDSEINQHLVPLKQRDPDAAAAIEALNRKLDCLMAQLEMDNRVLRAISHKVQEVSISACGIGFIADEPLPAESLVSLDLLLLPASQHIVTYGKVVACDMARGGFYARVDFHNMAHADQELLIQHVVQRQGEQIRSGKFDSELD